MEILSKKLKSGYQLSVTYDPNGPLSVVITNSKDEHIGQVFVSFDSMEDMVKRMSNYEIELTEDEVNSIKVKVMENTDKPKNESVVSKMHSTEKIVNDRLSQFVYD